MVSKIVRGVSVAIASAIITAMSASASFAATYSWTWSEGGPTLYSGILTTDTSIDCGVGCEIVNGISGSFIGASITAVLAADTFPQAGIPNDNHLLPAGSPVLDFKGISFHLANGDDVNIYWNDGNGTYVYYCATSCDPPFISGTFAVTSVNSTTPLPAALPFFATGLGALGLLGWRSKRKRKRAA